MDKKSVWLCALVLSIQFGCSRLANSPCPGIYGFYKDKNNPEDVYGKITLRLDDDALPVSSLGLKIYFTVAGPRSETDNGHIEPRGSLKSYNQGEAISFRVYFPVVAQIPKMTAVIVNGVTICAGPGDLYHSRKPVSGFFLQYTLTSEDLTPETSRPEIEPMVTMPPRPVDISTTQLPLPSAPTTTEECGVVASDVRVPLILGHSYERGEIPWLVAIYKTVQQNLLFICGGTLVSDRHVVTAAHCMSLPNVLTPITEIVIKAGVHSLKEWGGKLTVTSKLMAATIHEEYNPNTLKNDILVMTLDERIMFNKYIRPACLWSGDTDLSRIVGAIGVVAGWGNRGTLSTGNADEPQMVRVPIVSTKECRGSRSDFHKLTYNNTLCAGDRNGAGPCNGDSGGGLYLFDSGKWRLRGIVSVSLRMQNGANICNLSEYVVYTDTAQFLPWIRNILSEKYFD